MAAAIVLATGWWRPAGGEARGEHNAPTVDLPPDFVDEILLNDLPPVAAMAWAPDGRLFLARKDGQVLI